MQRKIWITIILFAACGMTSFADDTLLQSPMMSGLISDSTLIVVRGRTDQMDPERSRESLQKLWRQLCDAGELNEEDLGRIQPDFTRLLSLFSQIPQGYREITKEAKSLFGTDEYYFFMDQNRLLMDPLMIGIRSNSQLDTTFEQPEFHEKLLRMGCGFLMRKTGEWYILIPLAKSNIVEKSVFEWVESVFMQHEVTPSNDEESLVLERRTLCEKTGKVTDEILQNRRLVDASVFDEAFDYLNSADGTPHAAIQIVCVIPDHAKRIFSELKPTLPEPLESVQIASLLKPRWIAIAIDTDTPELFYTIRTNNEEDMNEFYGASCTVRKYAIDSLQPVAAAAYLRWLCTDFESVDPYSILNSDGLAPEDKERWLNFQKMWNAFLANIFDRVVPQPVKNQIVMRINPENTLANIQKEFAMLIQFSLHTSGKNLLSHLAKNECSEHLKYIGLAFHNYHDSLGCFPPPYSVDENGKPLHSWRVLILPYLVAYGENRWWQLYQKIRLDEPWDSPWNRQFHDQMPDIYRCLAYTSDISDEKTAETMMRSMTPYSLVVGPDAYLPLPKKMCLREIYDGTSNTMLVTERRDPVCWMEPVDLSQDVAFQGVDADNGIGSPHPMGFNMVCADGATRYIPSEISQTILHAIITIAGGEVVSF